MMRTSFRPPHLARGILRRARPPAIGALATLDGPLKFVPQGAAGIAPRHLALPGFRLWIPGTDTASQRRGYAIMVPFSLALTAFFRRRRVEQTLRWNALLRWSALTAHGDKQRRPGRWPGRLFIVSSGAETPLPTGLFTPSSGPR